MALQLELVSGPLALLSAGAGPVWRPVGPAADHPGRDRLAEHPGSVAARRYRCGVTLCPVLITPSRVESPLLATSLYDDPAAELHEDASARLREHLALPGCSILRRSSLGVRSERLPGSRWWPRGGRRGRSQRATGFSRHCVVISCLPSMRGRLTDWVAVGGRPDLSVLRVLFPSGHWPPRPPRGGDRGGAGRFCGAGGRSLRCYLGIRRGAGVRAVAPGRCWPGRRVCR